MLVMHLWLVGRYLMLNTEHYTFLKVLSEASTSIVWYEMDKDSQVRVGYFVSHCIPEC